MKFFFINEVKIMSERNVIKLIKLIVSKNIISKN